MLYLIKIYKNKKINLYFCFNLIFLLIKVSLNFFLLDNIKKIFGVKYFLNFKYFNNYIFFIFYNKKNSLFYNETCLFWTLKMLY